MNLFLNFSDHLYKAKERKTDEEIIQILFF